MTRREVVRAGVRVVGAMGLIGGPTATWVMAGGKEAKSKIPGKGYLRVAYQLKPVGSYQEFEFSVWTSYLSVGTEAWRNVFNEGPFRKAASGFTRTIKVGAADVKFNSSGRGFEYRLQLQFKEENGNSYTALLEDQGQV
ncbi:MAG: hypothetical protein GC162_06215 [Planctomycetes bacterium]|nr:hypothetical protein [Planctomycetota bacterium]